MGAGQHWGQLLPPCTRWARVAESPHRALSFPMQPRDGGAEGPGGLRDSRLCLMTANES